VRDPAFIAEVAVIREALRARPLDGRALLAVAAQSVERIASKPKAASLRRLPPNPGPEQRARIEARYAARGEPLPDWNVP
jgi:hypothetical protein